MNKRRISVYIDGFNLFHSALQENFSNTPLDKQRWPELRWLDLRKLALNFINPKLENLTSVYYFSAPILWKPAKAAKHKEYMNALRTVGVEVILGQFKEKDRSCPLCKQQYKAHEEKETDINIAISILSDALQDKFDTALILSGDSDLAPVISKMKMLFPTKKIGIILPPYQYGAELTAKADYVKKIHKSNLRKSLLPHTVSYLGGLINAPADWLPPV
ncbi:MAG: NYN domain-containing protein [Proteobacteria bacterium]|nr:NYN domain-containing protein [Pseudomonadota bacterium]